MVSEVGKIRQAFKLSRLVSKFGMAQKNKLFSKIEDGSYGWEEPDEYEGMKSALVEKVADGKWVCVANYAMMLWHLEQKELLERDFLVNGNEPEHNGIVESLK